MHFISKAQSTFGNYRNFTMITRSEDSQHLCNLFISFNIGKDWRELERKGNEEIMEAAPKIGIEQLSAVILLPPQKGVALMLSKDGT